MTIEEKCIFCKIVNKKADATIEHETDTILVFRDIYPSAKFHFQAIPKVHILDPKTLTRDDIGLVKEMKEALEVALSKYEMTGSDILMGFHWPPFNSVKHLHLHGLAPASSVGVFKGMMFKPNTMWFKTVDYVINEYLPNIPPK